MMNLAKMSHKMSANVLFIITFNGYENDTLPSYLMRHFKRYVKTDRIDRCI